MNNEYFTYSYLQGTCNVNFVHIYRVHIDRTNLKKKKDTSKTESNSCASYFA